MNETEMSEISGQMSNLPPEHRAIQAKCFHPTGGFVEFKQEEVEQSIPQRFEKIVRRYPQRLAIKTSTDAFTYNALNKMANRVARAILLKCGEDHGRIALLFEQGPEAIGAMLGTLKAGKIYVPLVPSYTRAWTDSILEDTEAALILTNKKNFSLANELARNQRPLIIVDDSDTSVSDENIELSIPPDALACVLYTSGSTGQPKGVVHNHRNLIHLAMRNTNLLHICSEDRLSFLSTYSHIAGIKDIFRALLNGAALFPLDLKQEGLVDFADWLIKEEITIYHSVPSVFRRFVETLDEQREFPKIRLVHLGAEPVSNRDFELYKKHFSATCILLNSFGATEMSGYQQYLIDKNTPLTGDIVPAGYAIEGTEVVLLSETGQRVGLDHEGEIAVMSRYLAVGYWRNPDLTRAVFLSGPSGGDERLYLTGDLGRMQPDGCLIHLGRKDLQMKIRGQRIEAAAIEASLLALDAIKEAVVMVREDRPGSSSTATGTDTRLVAYIVPAGKLPTISTLRRALAEKLPEYMVPSAFVVPDFLPVTSTGKIDRRALPAPGRGRPELNTPFVAPRSWWSEDLRGFGPRFLTLTKSAFTTTSSAWGVIR